MICLIFKALSDMACNSKRKKPKVIAYFIRYRAGNPPGSGDTSRYENETLAYLNEVYITTRHQGIKNNRLPKRLTYAFFCSEKLL